MVGLVPIRKGQRRPGIAGQNLRRLRLGANLTQDELAESSGVSRGTIAALETGLHASADEQTIKRLAHALGVPSAEFYGGTVTETRAAPIVQRFVESPYGQITRPTEEELDWLRGLPGLIWLNIEPTPEAIHHLLLARRSGKI